MLKFRVEVQFRFFDANHGIIVLQSGSCQYDQLMYPSPQRLYW